MTMQQPSFMNNVSGSDFAHIGWVEKGRSKVFSFSNDTIKYHRRFLGLSRTHLMMYSSEPTKSKNIKTRKSVALWDILNDSTSSGVSGQLTYFIIATSGRSYKFRTNSEEETAAWVDTIFAARRKVFLEGHGDISEDMSEKFFDENPEENFVDVLSPSSTPIKLADDGDDATTDTQSSHVPTPEKEDEQPEEDGIALPVETLNFHTPERCRAQMGDEPICDQNEYSDDVQPSSVRITTPDQSNIEKCVEYEQIPQEEAFQSQIAEIELPLTDPIHPLEKETGPVLTVLGDETPQPQSQIPLPTPSANVECPSASSDQTSEPVGGASILLEQIPTATVDENICTEPLPTKENENEKEEQIDDEMTYRSSSCEITEVNPASPDANTIDPSIERPSAASPSIHKGLVSSMRTLYERIGQ
jgi:hypothetical protein